MKLLRSIALWLRGYRVREWAVGKIGWRGFAVRHAPHTLDVIALSHKKTKRGLILAEGWYERCMR